MSLFAYIFIFLLLLGASAFFSGTETVLFSLSRFEKRRYRSKRTLVNNRISEALSKPRQLLVTILIGNELANVALSAVGAALLSLFIRGDVKTESVISVLVITPILLIGGEIIPKSVALHFARTLAPIIIYPLSIFSRMVWPLRVVLTWFADLVTHLFGGSMKGPAYSIMEKEFRTLVDLGQKEGVVEKEERELIHNIFDFADKVVEEIMTTKEKIFSLPVKIPYSRLLAKVREAKFSRIPLYDKNPNRIVGVLHVRDLIQIEHDLEVSKTVSIESFLNKPLFVETNEPIDRLLKAFQMTGLHMAIVMKDEEVIGVVTLDDVLEEIFGEIRDKGY